MKTKADRTTILTAPVDLSQYHAGQMVEHSATMTAECRSVVRDTGAFGHPIYGWQPVRWRPTHHVYDRSDRSQSTTPGPWCETRDEAEAWLESRGLRLGGDYWHMARAV